MHSAIAWITFAMPASWMSAPAPEPCDKANATALCPMTACRTASESRTSPRTTVSASSSTAKRRVVDERRDLVPVPERPLDDEPAGSACRPEYDHLHVLLLIFERRA